MVDLVLSRDASVNLKKQRFKCITLKRQEACEKIFNRTARLREVTSAHLALERGRILDRIRDKSRLTLPIALGMIIPRRRVKYLSTFTSKIALEQPVDSTATASFLGRAFPLPPVSHETFSRSRRIEPRRPRSLLAPCSASNFGERTGKWVLCGIVRGRERVKPARLYRRCAGVGRGRGRDILCELYNGEYTFRDNIA